MFQPLSSYSKVVCRCAALGALAVGFVGAAHADYQLLSPTILETLNSSNTAGDASGLGSGTSTGLSGAGLGTATQTLGNGNSSGFNNHFAPSAAPEPFTVGLALAGLGIAARRMRRSSK